MATSAVVLAEWGRNMWPALWVSLSSVSGAGTRAELARLKTACKHADPQLVHFFGEAG